MKLSRQLEYRIVEIALLLMAIMTGALLVTYLFNPSRSIGVMFIAGMVFTASLVLSIRLWMNPDQVRATQSEAMLNLASATLAAMNGGFNNESAQRVCEMLLPSTSGIAVAITDREVILGYAGAEQDLNRINTPIRTIATHATLEDNRLRIMRSSAEIGFPVDRTVINAAIIVPLCIGGDAIGTLKFYYPRARMINETQISIAAGFGELISTQIAANQLDEQRKLATSMELKMLQSQINPHFLFNTINTIASLVRTDPATARTLLREFAAFYRSTLENSDDLIPLSRELEQTRRYFGFEMARFGEERLSFEENLPDELHDVLVPSFMIQPLVENAVKHGMPSEGQLRITVGARRTDEDDLVLEIRDDGVGMSSEQRRTIMQTESQKGLGIAVRNINDRIRGYYGTDSYMHVDSSPGEGTAVTLFLKRGCSPDASIENELRKRALGTGAPRAVPAP